MPDLKQILIDHPESWDHDGMRPVVRSAFRNMIDCGTGALGTIRFAAPSGEELNLPCTCKSPACPSCGHRAMLDWRRAIGSDLPDIPYWGGLFSIHKDLWEIFRENRRLLLGLPAIAANVLQDWADQMHGARVPIIVVLHTFQGRLVFYPHVHFVVSSVGLDWSGSDLVRCIRWDFYYVQQALMKKWRHTVVDYLLAALDHGLISSTRPRHELRALFEEHRGRWWYGGIRECTSVRSLVHYMARYLRRPPIAQRRLLSYDGKAVRFSYKDTKTKQILVECYTADEFIRRWADQVPDHYRHGVRYFGLLAPRCKGRVYEVFLALLKQKRRPRPRRIPWRKLIWLTFRRDRLLTSSGEVMQRIGWRAPERPRDKTGQILRR
jgi:hypothetical protein